MGNRTGRLIGNSWQALQKSSCSATGNAIGHELMHTAGVIFMGVPFRGSHALLYRTCDLRARIGRQLDNETSDYLVQLLRPDNEESMDLLESFYRSVAQDMVWFPICCFYETRDADYRAALERVADKLSFAIDDIERGQAGNDSDVLKMLQQELRRFTEGALKMLVVDRESATLQGQESIALDVRHGDLIRFPGPDDVSFRQVSSRLREMAKNGSSVLPRALAR